VPKAATWYSRALLLRLEIRGQVELTSDDPHVALRIRLNFSRAWAAGR
jgi:hypothetical protein